MPWGEALVRPHLQYRIQTRTGAKKSSLTDQGVQSPAYEKTRFPPGAGNGPVKSPRARMTLSRLPALA